MTAFSQTAVDFSGIWAINLRHTRTSVSGSYHDDESHKYRQLDPGIGWPPNVGPKGLSTDGLNALSMLREGAPDLKLLIIQTADEIQVRRKFTVAGNEQMIVQHFALNGSESRNPASSGQGEFVSSSTWENGGLVNWGQLTDLGRSLTVREEYSISKDGKKLNIQRSGYYSVDPNTFTKNLQKPNVTTTLVFEKK
jgi:hypothetical protein